MQYINAIQLSLIMQHFQYKNFFGYKNSTKYYTHPHQSLLHITFLQGSLSLRDSSVEKDTRDGIALTLFATQNG